MKLLLTGDSITAAGRDSGDPADLGDGYVVRVAASLPDHTVLNTGINGNKVPDLARRWQRDVLDHRPDLVSVKIGVNDTWHGHVVGRTGTTNEDFRDGCRDLLRRTRAAGVDRLVLVEPFMVPVDDHQAGMLPDLKVKMRVVRELAAEFEALFVPLHEAFLEAAAHRDPAQLVLDGVHPAPAGHDLIAAAWLDVVGPTLEATR